MGTDSNISRPLVCPVTDPFRKLSHLESALESIEWQALELFRNDDPAVQAEAREMVQAFAFWMFKIASLELK